MTNFDEQESSSPNFIELGDDSFHSSKKHIEDGLPKGISKDNQATHEPEIEKPLLGTSQPIPPKVIPPADQKSDTQKCRYWSQFIASFGSAMSQFVTGTIYGYSGVALPLLMNPNSGGLISNTAEESMFGSIINIGNLIGSLAAGIAMTYFGQRRSILYILPITCASWILLGTATSLEVLIAARFIFGFTTGVLASNSYNFVVELSHTSMRSRLLAMSDLLRQLGFTLVMVLGSFSLSWRTQAFVEIPFVCLNFIILYFVYDSPRWLAFRNKKKEAHKALTFYRGSKYDVDKELTEICNQASESTRKISVRSQLKVMFSKGVLPIMLATSFFMTFIHGGGNIIMISYTVTIFESAKVEISPHISGIVSCIMRLMGVMTYLLIANRFNRKTLFIVPLFISALATTALGLFFYLQTYQDISSLSWVPLITASCFTYFTSIYYPAMMLVRGEILPNAVRSLGSGIHFSLMSIGMFLVTWSFPYTTKYLGFHWTFWIYSAISLINMIIVALFIPETKGKTLEAIGDMHIKKNKRNSVEMPL